MIGFPEFGYRTPQSRWECYPTVMLFAKFCGIERYLPMAIVSRRLLHHFSILHAIQIIHSRKPQLSPASFATFEIRICGAVCKLTANAQHQHGSARQSMIFTFCRAVFTAEVALQAIIVRVPHKTMIFIAVISGRSARYRRVRISK